MGLTELERNEIHNKKREWSLAGDPMKVMYLDRALEADMMPDPSLMTDLGVKTDIPLVGGVNLEIPPRWGKGSGQAVWAEFAAKITDTDAEVLSRLTRNDIVKMLEANGNIPTMSKV